MVLLSKWTSSRAIKYAMLLLPSFFLIQFIFSYTLVTFRNNALLKIISAVILKGKENGAPHIKNFWGNS